MLGIDFEDDGRTVVPFDFDGDGDLDLATGSLQNIKILQNRLTPQNFVRIELRDNKGVRQAIGAEVKVYTADKVQWDYVKATAGFQAQPSRTLHFGLGDAKRIEKIEILWPDRKFTQVSAVSMNRHHVIGRNGIIKISPLHQWPKNDKFSQNKAFDLNTQVADLTGSISSLAGTGKVTIVNFWAPWCEPCKKEIPYLQKIKANYTAIEVIGVSVETDKKDDVIDYVKKTNIGYKQRYATDELLESFFGDSGKLNLPSTFVFDQKGELRRAYHRPFDFDEISSLLNSLTKVEVDVGLALTTANLMQSRDRHTEAIRILTDTLKSAPKSVKLLLELSKSYAFSGQANKAFATLEKAVSVAPKDAFAWYARGVIAKDIKPSEVIPSFKNACRIAPRNKQFCTALGAAYFRVQAMKDAKAVFETLSRNLPNDVDVWINLAKARQLSNSGGAKRAIQRALELAPDNVEAKALIDRLAD